MYNYNNLLWRWLHRFALTLVTLVYTRSAASGWLRWSCRSVAGVSLSGLPHSMCQCTPSVVSATANFCRFLWSFFNDFSFANRWEASMSTLRLLYAPPRLTVIHHALCSSSPLILTHLASCSKKLHPHVEVCLLGEIKEEKKLQFTRVICDQL